MYEAVGGVQFERADRRFAKSQYSKLSDSLQLSLPREKRLKFLMKSLRFPKSIPQN